MIAFSEWILKRREKEIDVRYLNGHYYLYRVTSKYDPKIKRSRKMTLAYLRCTLLYTYRYFMGSFNGCREGE